MKILKLKTTDFIPKNYTGIIEWEGGIKAWYKEMEYHREDGPARESRDGTREWFIEGKPHRTDGPAAEYINGYKEWWIEGKEYSGTIYLKKKIFLGKEKGKYSLEWLKFMTEDKIEEYPLIPGMEYEFIQSYGLQAFLKETNSE